MSSGSAHPRCGSLFTKVRLVVGSGHLTKRASVVAEPSSGLRLGRLGVQAHARRQAADHEHRVEGRTTATPMLSCGVDVRTVADGLGHSDVATTLGTYVHSTEGSARRARWS
jgi:site-specific recombinase XerD